MLKLVNANSLKSYRRLMKRLYVTTFPKAERMPYRILKKLVKEGKAEYFAIFDDERWIGINLNCTYDGSTFVYYLAIDDSCRNMGYGAKSLSLLRERYHGRLYLNIEACNPTAKNYNVRVSRKNFYLRNGFVDYGTIIETKTETYEMLCCGGEVTRPEYDALFKHLKYFDKIFR